jgi:hypothetical protein
MRAHLKQYYGPQWGNKVNKMSDAQVIAIYNRLINRKKK